MLVGTLGLFHVPDDVGQKLGAVGTEYAGVGVKEPGAKEGDSVGACPYRQGKSGLPYRFGEEIRVPSAQL